MRARRGLDDDRAGAVGQRPAQELGRPPATDDARSARETSSEPTTTAAAWSPAATARTAPANAAMLDAHTPPDDSSSIGPPPSRPCTIDANPGTSTSPCVVPVANMPTSSAAMPRSLSAASTAAAASSSLSIVTSPRASSA